MSELVEAIYKYNSAKASALIRSGVDVNYGNPLYIAIDRSLPDIASQLIDAGANVDAEFLSQSPLYQAIKKNLPNVAMRLIEAGANVNSSENLWGKTAFEIANEKQMYDVMIAMIKSNLIYLNRFDSLKIDNIEVQKALSFKFPEYPLRFDFTLNDTTLLNSKNYRKVQNILLLRQTPGNALYVMPIELIELLLRQMFK